MINRFISGDDAGGFSHKVIGKWWDCNSLTAYFQAIRLRGVLAQIKEAYNVIKIVLAATLHIVAVEMIYQSAPDFF
jgi:hypothetical protein